MKGIIDKVPYTHLNPISFLADDWCYYVSDPKNLGFKYERN